MAYGKNLDELIEACKTQAYIQFLGKKSTSSSSLKTGRISSGRMEEILQQLKLKTTRSSTTANYYRIWQSFNKFIVRLDSIPGNWENRVMLYVAYLIDTGHQSSSVKSYLSGIKKILSFIDYELSCDQVILASLTKACKLQNDCLKIRRPIRTKLLEQLLFEIQRKFKNQYYLEMLYKTIFTIAYYGMLRIGEITESDHIVKAKDVNIGTNKKKILLILYTSKTNDESSRPQQIKISELDDLESNRFFCPFKLIRHYFPLRGPYKKETDQFFVFRDNSPVKAHHVRTVLRDLIKDIGLDPNLFDCHSFRVGRASQLFKLGISIEMIKKLGRWKSNAIYKYIKN